MFSDAQDFLNPLAGQIQDLVRWGVVPLTMAWLAGRWLFLDLAAVTDNPKELERLTRLSRTGWITGFLLALMLFAGVVVPGNPLPATFREPIDYPQCCVYVLAVSIGALLGFLPRLFWLWIRANVPAPAPFPKSLIDGQLGWSAFLACALGIFSLLSYFLWRESHGILFAGFVWLLIGYRLVRLFEVSLW
jgi:hypothetical protein